MQTKRMIINPSFCASASRLMGMLWLPMWCSVLVSLWGPARVEAQDVPADRTPIFELHFEDDSLRVVRNEMSRTRRAATKAGLSSRHTRAAGRAPSAPSQMRFPFQAVANNQAKKVVWFNADGTIRTQQSIPEGRKALVADNGAYVLLVDGTGYAFERGSQSVELLDAQGTRLWKAELAPDAFLSPTGETVVSLNIEALKYIPFSIWGPQGKLAEYDSIVGNASFSADGQFLFAGEYTDRNGSCVSLFDKAGQRLWQRYCNSTETQNITGVYISEHAKFMAFAYYLQTSWNPASGTPPPPTLRYLTVLDQTGDILWTQPSSVWDIAFSEKGKFIATLQGIEGRSSYDREIVVANIHTGDIQRKFSIPHPKEKPIRGYTQLSFLQNYNLLLRYYQRTSDGDILAHLQLFDPTGVLYWERTINPETENWDNRAKPAWLQKGPLLGISMGRVFQLFDFNPHNLPEE